jgi:hypothetical protein
MQFYCLVPVIFFISNWISQKFSSKNESNVVQIFNFFLLFISFTCQSLWFDDVQARYMLLISRLWQFTVGFIAYDFRKLLYKVGYFSKKSYLFLV